LRSLEQIGTATDNGNQRFPSISSFKQTQVLVWQTDPTGTGKSNIFCRFNNMNPDFRVNQAVNGTFTNPQVAMITSETFLVVWQSLNQDGSGWGVFGRFFSRQFPTSGEFRINNFTISNQVNPSVSCNNAIGKLCVVIWQSLNQDGSGIGVYGR
jgi:hypothetical protein